MVSASSSSSEFEPLPKKIKIEENPQAMQPGKKIGKIKYEIATTIADRISTLTSNLKPFDLERFRVIASNGNIKKLAEEYISYIPPEKRQNEGFGNLIRAVNSRLFHKIRGWDY